MRKARVGVRPANRPAEVPPCDHSHPDVSVKGRRRNHHDRVGGLNEMAQTATRTKTTTLEIEDLHVEVEGKKILKGIDLTIRQGEVHALMGPNGSGKSTLAQVLMGRTSYIITRGTVRFRGEDITKWTPDKRAQHGLFLAFQYPTEIPGVSVVNFLRSAYKAAKGEQISALAFRKRLKEKMNLLGVEDQMVNRYVNQGFSGGEKKKNEVFQLV